MIQIQRQSASLIKHTDPLEVVEHAARICYDSVDKMQPGGSAAFVRGLIKRGHFTPLEHAYVRIYLDQIKNPDSQVYVTGLYHFAAPGDYPLADRRLTRGAFYRGKDSKGEFVSGNLRDLVWYLGKHEDPIEFVQREGIELDPNYAVLDLVTDRGIATELFRHRTMSYDDDGYERGYKATDVDFVPEPSINQQSTRYVNFTRKPVYMILPEPAEWAYDLNDPFYINWLAHCQKSVNLYGEMINGGATPEYARNVLPLSLGTRVIMSGSILNWLYVLNLRLPKGAHPQVRLLGSYIWDILWKTHQEYINGVLDKKALDNEWPVIDYAAEAAEIQNLAHQREGASGSWTIITGLPARQSTQQQDSETTKK